MINSLCLQSASPKGQSRSLSEKSHIAVKNTAIKINKDFPTFPFIFIGKFICGRLSLARREKNKMAPNKDAIERV